MHGLLPRLFIYHTTLHPAFVYLQVSPHLCFVCATDADSGVAIYISTLLTRSETVAYSFMALWRGIPISGYDGYKYSGTILLGDRNRRFCGVTC